MKHYEVYFKRDNITPRKVKFLMTSRSKKEMIKEIKKTFPKASNFKIKEINKGKKR